MYVFLRNHTRLFLLFMHVFSPGTGLFFLFYGTDGRAEM